MGADSLEHLREADVVAVPLEAEGPADDIEQRLQLSATQLDQQLIEQLVGYWRVIGASEASEW